MGLADLRFTLWNVHGLLSTVGELQDIAAGADVIIATETWTAPGANAPDLAGYKTFSCSRVLQSSQGRPNGGIACFIRLPLPRSVSVWRVACDALLLWLKLDKSLGLHHDLYLCAAYVAPRLPLTMRGKSPLTPSTNYCAMLLMRRCWGVFSWLATSTLGLARVQTLWTRSCKGNPRKGTAHACPAHRATYTPVPRYRCDHSIWKVPA